jgi:long-chain acyl-CoA synthetase
MAQGFEQVRKIHLDSEQFTVERDLITPTFKLKRPQLQKHYQAKIDAMYRKR